MTSRQISEKLTELQDFLEEVDQALDLIIAEFQAEVVPFVEAWIKDFVLTTVEENPDQVQNLGAGRLKELKAEIASLFAELPKLVILETKDKNDWPHYRNIRETEYGGKKNEPFFNKTFRSLISYIAPVLDHYGLKPIFKGQIEVWKKDENGTFKYTLITGFQELKVTSREKFEAQEQARNLLVKEIEQYKAELAKAKARELFESA
jgi:hypothetical protein